MVHRMGDEDMQICCAIGRFVVPTNNEDRASNSRLIKSMVVLKTTVQSKRCEGMFSFFPVFFIRLLG